MRRLDNHCDDFACRMVVRLIMAVVLALVLIAAVCKMQE
jgi:hypothetical protein